MPLNTHLRIKRPVRSPGRRKVSSTFKLTINPLNMSPFLSYKSKRQFLRLSLSIIPSFICFLHKPSKTCPLYKFKNLRHQRLPQYQTTPRCQEKSQSNKVLVIKQPLMAAKVVLRVDQAQEALPTTQNILHFPWCLLSCHHVCSRCSWSR